MSGGVKYTNVTFERDKNVLSMEMNYKYTCTYICWATDMYEARY